MFAHYISNLCEVFNMYRNYENGAGRGSVQRGIYKK